MLLNGPWGVQTTVEEVNLHLLDLCFLSPAEGVQSVSVQEAVVSLGSLYIHGEPAV